MNKYEDALRITEELKKLAAEFDITIITATQPAPGYRTPPKFEDDVIIIDYIGLLR